MVAQSISLEMRMDSIKDIDIFKAVDVRFTALAFTGFDLTLSVD